MLKQLREKCGLTRQELADLCGVNYRSLQDYEQGHKDITHAKGAVLYRLSLALGCTVEELLQEYLVPDCQTEYNGGIAKIEPSLPVCEIQACRFFSQQYKVCGRWRCEEDIYKIIFVYEGKVVALPFNAEFTEQTLPWLEEAAVMMIEDYIEEIEFERAASELGGSLSDEW